VTVSNRPTFVNVNPPRFKNECPTADTDCIEITPSFTKEFPNDTVVPAGTNKRCVDANTTPCTVIDDDDAFGPNVPAPAPDNTNTVGDNGTPDVVPAPCSNNCGENGTDATTEPPAAFTIRGTDWVTIVPSSCIRPVFTNDPGPFTNDTYPN
jgi:hypothetical protein